MNIIGHYTLLIRCDIWHTFIMSHQFSRVDIW